MFCNWAVLWLERGCGGYPQRSSKSRFRGPVGSAEANNKGTHMPASRDALQLAADTIGRVIGRMSVKMGADGTLQVSLLPLWHGSKGRSGAALCASLKGKKQPGVDKTKRV